MKLLKECQLSYNINTDETSRTINSLNEVNKITNGQEMEYDEPEEDEDEDEDNDDNESLVFSSDSNSKFLKTLLEVLKLIII